MMDDFLKLLRKKSDEQGGPMKGPKMEAKAAMAKELSDLLGSDLADGVKKVTVASDSEKGLEKGLEKAQEILDSKHMGEESEDSESMEGPEHESSESEDYEDMEDSGEESDIEDEIAKLEKELEHLKKKKK